MGFKKMYTRLEILILFRIFRKKTMLIVLSSLSSGRLFLINFSWQDMNINTTYTIHHNFGRNRTAVNDQYPPFVSVDQSRRSIGRPHRTWPSREFVCIQITRPMGDNGF